MRKSLLPLLCLSLLSACGAETTPLDMPETGSAPDTMGTDTASLAALPKLRVSDNKCFLVKEDGTPFFWLGDTARQVLPYLNRSEIQTYLNNRAARGFNVIQAVALGPLSGTGANAHGDVPFLNGNYTTPATTTGSDPNDATQYDFWDHVDYFINEAEARGIYTALLPTWGGPVANGAISASAAQSYGQFLGRRYASKPIIWVLGGDVSPVGTEAVWRALAKGIALGVSGTEDYSKVLMTYHPKGGTKSSLWFHNEPWLDFNMQQNGHGTSKTVWKDISYDYNLSLPKPTLDGEPTYEQILIDLQGPGHTNDADVRRFAYLTVFAGAFGITYGHNSVWQMYAPNRPPQFSPVNYWYEGINAPGAVQMKYLRQLMESRPMLVRIPDQGVLTQVINDATQYQRVQATRASDSSYAFVYSASGLPFTVNMDRIAGGTVRAHWYDPRTGKAQLLGTYANTGTRQFTPPSSGLGNDWVLVLDNASLDFPAPGGAPTPTVGFSLVSATASPTTVSRGGTVRLTSIFTANAAASGVNVKLDVRDSTGANTSDSYPIGNLSFTQGQSRTFQRDYTVPSTPGTYCRPRAWPIRPG
ncbi:glycoside hydrolase family 140 protein [Cystobacter fuscus]